jgi:hypothetical protein
MIEPHQNQKPKLRGQRKTLVLPRDHLTQKALNSDFDVVLLMAPIGYGKKTLMSQLESELPNPIVLKLDVDDSNPFTLISHIRTQLEGVIDFAQPAFDPSVATVNHLIAVIEALDRTEKDLQFFLHGSHVLNNSSAQLLERFIVKLPAGHRVFISGFNTSNLSLTEVYVSARVLTLEGHDLLLGLEEVTQMLSVFNSDLDAQQVFEKSAGVVSIVFVMANTNSLEAVSFEKFIENILNELPKDILSFLEKMSVFEVWNEETIAALELKAPKNWVEKVVSCGLPITVSNDGDLQPHGILLELLFERFKSEKEIFKSINSQAAQWYLGKDLSIKGIKHLILADEIELSENYAVQIYNRTVFQSGEYGILNEISNLFIGKTLISRIELIKVYNLIQLGLFKKAGEMLKNLFSIIDVKHKSYQDLIIININYLKHINKSQEALIFAKKNINFFTQTKEKLSWLYRNMAFSAFELRNTIEMYEIMNTWSKIVDINSDLSFIYSKICFNMIEINDNLIEKESKKLNEISKQRNNIDLQSVTSGYLSIYSAFHDNFEKAIIESESCYPSMSFHRPINSINSLGTHIDILILFEKFKEAQEYIKQALEKCEQLDVTTTTFKLQEFDCQVHLGNLNLTEYESRVKKLPIVDLTDQLTVNFHKARVAFIQKNYAKAISFSLNAIEDIWMPTRVRAWAYLVASYYQLGSNELTAALEKFNTQLSALGTLRAFTLDWQFLGSTFEALRDEGLLVDVKWIHAPTAQAVPRPKLEIATLGRYQVVLNDEPLDVPDDATELLAYLALYREKSIEEMLNDFAGLDATLDERAKLKKRLEYRFTVLREKFWAYCPTLVANKNDFFAFDKKTGKYRFGNHFALRFDAKQCQVLTGEALLDVYKGTFLQKSESPWVASLADELEQQFMTAAHEHASTLEVKDAIRVYEKILSINETDETASWFQDAPDGQNRLAGTDSKLCFGWSRATSQMDVKTLGESGVRVWV